MSLCEGFKFSSLAGCCFFFAFLKIVDTGTGKTNTYESEFVEEKKQSVQFRYQTKAVTVMIKPLLMHYGTFGQHSLEPEPHSKSLPNASFMIAVPVFFKEFLGTII